MTAFYELYDTHEMNDKLLEITSSVTARWSYQAYELYVKIPSASFSGSVPSFELHQSVLPLDRCQAETKTRLHRKNFPVLQSRTLVLVPSYVRI